MADLEAELERALATLRAHKERTIAPRPKARKWHRPIPNPVTHKQDRKDWELIVKWQGLSAKAQELRKKPLPVRWHELDMAVWAETDAYGQKGWMPPQGWDWSGIRDSSAAAQRRMAAVIRKLLRRWKVRP